MAHGFALLADQVELTRHRQHRRRPRSSTACNVSPDLDTVMYTLAGLANNDTGWGVRDETWSAAADARALRRADVVRAWRPGPRHAHCAHRRGCVDGDRLTSVTTDLARALGVERHAAADERRAGANARSVPLTAGSTSRTTSFGAATATRSRRSDSTVQPMPRRRRRSRSAIDLADVIVIAPSNPFLSVAPILALSGIDRRPAQDHARPSSRSVRSSVARPCVARPRTSCAHSARTPSATGIATFYATRYAGLVDCLFIDNADSADADAIAGSRHRAALRRIS